MGMRSLLWTFFLIMPCVLVGAPPVQELPSGTRAATDSVNIGLELPNQNPENSAQEQVISVRITSSVAVGRGKVKINRNHERNHEKLNTDSVTYTPLGHQSILASESNAELTTTAPPLAGANIEFIKQLNSKKEARALHNYEKFHTNPAFISKDNDSIADSSIKSAFDVNTNEEDIENIEDIPLARSVISPSSKNYIQGPSNKVNERESQRLTTVNFDVVHDLPKVTSSYETNDPYNPSQTSLTNPPKLYSEPPPLPNFYSDPAKVYSQPAQVYSEPAKFYSEPAKVYSEPAKIYSEPAKIYSEPAKIYSEPAKFYSQPASLHLTPGDPSDYPPWQYRSSSTTILTPIIASTTQRNEHQPEKNYEIDEKLSVLTDGRSHGIQDQESTTESCKQENCKVGYVVEGRQYRKYRVEERTSDGFIVGEYGVVRNEDGALRGVRYTADGDTNPRLIYDALMKFLQLK